MQRLTERRERAEQASAGVRKKKTQEVGRRKERGNGSLESQGRGEGGIERNVLRHNLERAMSRAGGARAHQLGW